MAETTTEAERIRRIIAVYRKDAETFDEMGKPDQATRLRAEANAVQHWTLPLAKAVDSYRDELGKARRECDRLHAAITVARAALETPNV